MRRIQSKRVSSLVAAFALAGGSSAAFGSEGAGGDKSAYTLLNPTPRTALREMDTDRPDVSESPYTVDAGHLQIELSLLEYARDGGTEEWDVLPANLKIGLTNNVDVQFVLLPYQDITSDHARHAAGFGDAQLRVKVNLWGNDGGDSALAVMPFIQFPTGENDLTIGHTEGGLIVPFGIALDEKTHLTTMLVADFVRDGENDGWDTDLIHTASLWHEIADGLGVFVEYVGVLPLGGGDADYEAYADAGVTYALTEDLQLDVALNVGLTDNAEDLRILAGVSYRL